jgi:hypothetical protein
LDGVLPLKQIEACNESPQQQEMRTTIKTPKHNQMTTNANSKENVYGMAFLDDTATKIKSSKRSGTGLNDPSCISPFSNRIFNYQGVSEVSKMQVSINQNGNHYYI